MHDELTRDLMRKSSFFFQHPKYKKDSLVTEEITFDLLTTLDRIEKGEIRLCDALKV